MCLSRKNILFSLLYELFFKRIFHMLCSADMFFNVTVSV
uniref:Uncharacterized protein n=1 Tax=Anguilla anguilla TaxID=7936 RepID=A0A0E9PS69_ANGAN